MLKNKHLRTKYSEPTKRLLNDSNREKNLIGIGSKKLY